MSRISHDSLVPKINKQGVRKRREKIADRQKNGKFISLIDKREKDSASLYC